MASDSGLSVKDKDQLSHELILFADKLGPSKAFGKDGKMKVQNVIKAFQGTKAYSIARVYFGGSVGKNTSVIFPDFDCVMFLNTSEEPPLDKELTRFELFLKDKFSELEIDPDSIHKKSVTVSFEFTNGMEVDLLAGINFSSDPKEQRRIVLEKMESLVDKGHCYYYGSSLAETQINFLKKQSTLCHQLIRLAKYWFKSLSLGESIFGASAMMEMICAAVVAREPDLDMIDSFKRFLDQICELDTVKIAFYKNDNDTWQLLSSDDFNSKKYKNYYPQAILVRKRFIMEPSSPFNDLAESLRDDGIIKKLGFFAETMLERIAELEAPLSNRMKTLSTVSSIPPEIHFDQFFQPFPMRLRDSYPYSGIPTYLLVNYTFSPYDSPNCKTDENKLNLFKNNHAAGKVAQTISNNLLFLIRARAKKVNKTEAYELGIANICVDDAKEAVKAIINENFGISKFIKESGDEKKHKGYDVTLYVPYRLETKVNAVQLSLKWYRGTSE